jgi:hypothetical protein
MAILAGKRCGLFNLCEEHWTGGHFSGHELTSIAAGLLSYDVIGLTSVYFCRERYRRLMMASTYDCLRKVLAMPEERTTSKVVLITKVIFKVARLEVFLMNAWLWARFSFKFTVFMNLRIVKTPLTGNHYQFI